MGWDGTGSSEGTRDLGYDSLICFYFVTSSASVASPALQLPLAILAVKWLTVLLHSLGQTAVERSTAVLG